MEINIEEASVMVDTLQRTVASMTENIVIAGTSKEQHKGIIVKIVPWAKKCKKKVC